MRKNLFLLLFFFPFVVFGQSLTGKVIYVSDGDTFHFVEKGKAQSQKIRIRLAEVDCPESSQPFGLEAKEFVIDRVLKKTVLIHKTDTDQYGRTIAHVFYADGKNLAEELLSNGYAWHFKRYSERQSYADLEQLAKSKKLGLFKNSDQIPPWEWRKQH